MPELPEVETTCRGIEPHIIGKTFQQVVVRQPQLRWPVTPGIAQALKGERVTAVGRRAKYLLLQSTGGTAIVHLGMSGSLRILTKLSPAGPHDHVDFLLSGSLALRYTDPRRFGSILWTNDDPLQHPLLETLGPEPLANSFSGDYLWKRARGRKAPVKNFIMDGKMVVGVGNIYASEALFRAGIHPGRQARRISLARYQSLVSHIKAVLGEAITQGGTTLRDFVDSDGQPGYFSQSLQVYGRAGEPCNRCSAAIKSRVIGQRNTFFCTRCQT